MATLDLAITVQNDSLTKAISTINALSDAISRMKAPITNATKAVQHHTSAFKKLDSAIKRIAFYRMIRFGMKQVMQSFIQGVKHVALYSQALNNLDSTRANATMSEFATNLLYIKNSLGAAVMPLLQALVPVGIAIANAFAAAANAVNQFFHALKGEAVFTKAKKYAVDFADGLGAASGKAKELKKQVFGFDELNIFNSPSAGGGGGGSGMDYSKMFEESEVSDMFQQIRELAESAEWEQIGTLIADKLNTAIEKFDAAKFGSRIGNGLQAAIGTAFGFLTRLDFKQAGAKLAETINNIVNKVKWDEVGGLLARGLTGVIDFAAGYIANFDTAEWASDIGKTVTGMIDHFRDWIGNVDWVKVGQTFFQKVYDFVTGINYTEIAQKFFTMLGEFIYGAFETLQGFLGKVFEKWNAYCGVEAGDTGVDTAGKWLLGIWNGLVGIATWVYNNVVTPFFNALRGGLGLDKEGGGMESAGKDAIKDFLDGLTLSWADVKKWVLDKVQWFKNQFKGMKDWLANKNGQVTWTPSMDSNSYRPSNAKEYAEGGQPQTGSLFWAGEAGAELIGQVGGKTTVTTHDQFSAGMSEIMDNTNTVIMQAAQGIVQAVLSKDMTVINNISDRAIVNAYDRGKRLGGTGLAVGSGIV